MVIISSYLTIYLRYCFSSRSLGLGLCYLVSSLSLFLVCESVDKFRLASAVSISMYDSLVVVYRHPCFTNPFTSSTLDLSSSVFHPSRICFLPGLLFSLFSLFVSCFAFRRCSFLISCEPFGRTFHFFISSFFFPRSLPDRFSVCIPFRSPTLTHPRHIFSQVATNPPACRPGLRDSSPV